MSVRLHPQNDRVGTAGLIAPGLEHFRHPAVYVTEHGEVKHETPLCPHVRGRTHYAVCREEALYIYGERRCSTCEMHRWDSGGWTDPRFRRDR